ncbi:MAG TPA: methionyl-tRNA formyltransferase [Gemmatimonadales bacterium]|nr:methionyl-tRNA formyltransferase [Gemmatimonadales bacterium]
MRIVFFGTPDFAVPSLRALEGEGFDVAAVVTQPDRPHGRSRSEVIPPPVKLAALEYGIPVLQPEQPNDPAFLDELRAMRPDLGVVVAYGHLLKAELLSLPTHGMVNVHASLLPRYRGAAPITHAILAGDAETGVSIMQMDEGLDTGPVLLRVPTAIAADETGGELTARLAELGALALVEALTLIASGTARAEPQDHAAATYAPKITRDFARIDWARPREWIARFVRALDPKPGAWTTLDGREVKLFGPLLADAMPGDVQPGAILATDPALIVAAGGGALQFLDVQPSGRTRMAASEWIRGRGVRAGDRFE